MTMKKEKIVFSFIGATIIIAFLVAVNYIINPDNKWSVYPSLVVVFWPIMIYHFATKRYKALALVSSLTLVAFLGIINYVSSVSHPWFLYAAYPILWWPILMYSGKWCKKLSFAILSSLSLIAYYIVLNIVLAPGHPWAIYTTFVFIWWPFIHYYIVTKNHMSSSIIGAAVTSIFFIAVNYVSTPDIIWAIYPIFLVLWWPLVIYCFSYMNSKSAK